LKNKKLDLISAKTNINIKESEKLGDPVTNHIKLIKIVKISLVTIEDNDIIPITDMNYNTEGLSTVTKGIFDETWLL
jgi:hypothetical protein